MKILKNPDNGAPIGKNKLFVINHAGYKLDVGETMAFEDNVADVLLATYGFLEEVKVETVAGGKFKCPYCEYVSDEHIGVYGHMRANHKDQPKAKPEQATTTSLEEVPKAKGKPIISLQEQRERADSEFYEEQQLKATGDFYGPGLEKDVPGEE